MPRFPQFPRDEDEERAPDPQDIVDRIINGRLRPPRPSTGPSSSG